MEDGYDTGLDLIGTKSEHVEVVALQSTFYLAGKSGTYPGFLIVLLQPTAVPLS